MHPQTKRSNHVNARTLLSTMTSALVKNSRNSIIPCETHWVGNI